MPELAVPVQKRSGQTVSAERGVVQANVLVSCVHLHRGGGTHFREDGALLQFLGCDGIFIPAKLVEICIHGEDCFLGVSC